MRRLLTLAVTVLAVALVVGSVSAGPEPALSTAPTGFTCVFTSVTTANDTIHCSWDLLLGASKYSVDGTVNYELGNTLGPLGVEYDFGTPTNGVDIPLTSFPADINADLTDDTLMSLVLKVKGLNPPKKLYNQNNPFSSPTVTCIVSTATCS